MSEDDVKVEGIGLGFIWDKFGYIVDIWNFFLDFDIVWFCVKFFMKIFCWWSLWIFVKFLVFGVVLGLILILRFIICIWIDWS